MLAESIGLAAAAWPQAWLGLFGDDPLMIEAGSAYLRRVAPTYGFFALGLTLYFASQGAGRLAPIGRDRRRLARAAADRIDELVVRGVAAGLVIYGAMLAAAVRGGVWFRRP